MFRLMVAESSDLVTWINPRQLHDRAGMGKFDLAFGGVLLVYEANPAGIGPSVAVCFYGTVDAFLSGASCKRQFLAGRSLSSFAEGTPRKKKRFFLRGPPSSGGTPAPRRNFEHFGSKIVAALIKRNKQAPISPKPI